MIREILIFAVFAVGLVGLAFATRAEEFDRPVSAGAIQAKIRAPAINPDAQLTQSISLKREDTGERVLCLPAINGEIVEGQTTLIDRADENVILYAFAYAGPDCTGDESLPSFNAYRVVFSAPDRPILGVE